MEDLVAGLEILCDEKARPEAIVDLLQSYKNTDWQRFATWDPFRYKNIFKIDNKICFS